MCTACTSYTRTLCDKRLCTFRTFVSTVRGGRGTVPRRKVCPDTLARTSLLICLRTTGWGPRCFVGHYRRYIPCTVQYCTTSTVGGRGMYGSTCAAAQSRSLPKSLTSRVGPFTAIATYRRPTVRYESTQGSILRGTLPIISLVARICLTTYTAKYYSTHRTGQSSIAPHYHLQFSTELLPAFLLPRC